MPFDLSPDSDTSVLADTLGISAYHLDRLRHQGKSFPLSAAPGMMTTMKHTAIEPSICSALRAALTRTPIFPDLTSHINPLFNDLARDQCLTSSRRPDRLLASHSKDAPQHSPSLPCSNQRQAASCSSTPASVFSHHDDQCTKFRAVHRHCTAQFGRR